VHFLVIFSYRISICFSLLLSFPSALNVSLWTARSAGSCLSSRRSISRLRNSFLLCNQNVHRNFHWFVSLACRFHSISITFMLALSFTSRYLPPRTSAFDIFTLNSVPQSVRCAPACVQQLRPATRYAVWHLSVFLLQQQNLFKDLNKYILPAFHRTTHSHRHCIQPSVSRS